MSKLLISLLVGVSLSWADANQLQKLLQAALNGSPSNVIPTLEQIAQASDDLNDPWGADVQQVLRLAMECLRSKEPKVREAGGEVFLGIAVKLNTPGTTSMIGDVKVIEPYIDDLMAFFNDPSDPVRGSIGYVLGATLQRCRVDEEIAAMGGPSDTSHGKTIFVKIITNLNNHLEDASNSPDDAGSMAACLLTNLPSDPAMVHRVLTFVAKRADPKVTIPVVSAIGLSKSHNAEALDFVGGNLENENPHVREQTVQAFLQLDRDVRAGLARKFAAQIGRLATDPKIGPQFREMATDALTGRDWLGTPLQ